MGKKVTYTEYKNKLFVNPYNFVPVDFGADVNKDITASNDGEAKEERITGFIQCHIKAKTPIAILDTEESTVDANSHMSYPFMKNGNGDYIIPGSAVRGVVRNVYETITNSCFSTMSEDTILTTRNSSKTPYAAGVLLQDEEKNWILYKADKYSYRTNAEFDTKKKEKYICADGKNYYSGETVYFQTKVTGNGRTVAAGISKDKNDDSKKGILVIGEKIFNKKSEGIFVRKDEVLADCETVQRAMKGLEATYGIYNNPSINKTADHYGYPAYRRMKKGGSIPIYYKYEGGKLKLSFAAIGRIAYEKTLNQLVQKRTPCKSRESLCPACALFGMVGKDSVGSSVRFTEATCTNPEKITNGKWVTLAELSQPRTSYMPFYTNATDADYENRIPGYDDEEKIIGGKRIPGREIRGRKFYWHSDNFAIINKSVSKTERNATVQVAEAGTEFQFKVYFDSITKAELQNLVFALNLGENEKNGKLCHKIGHGKPIGLGSAKIHVSEIKTRIFDGETYGYEDHNIDETMENFENIDMKSETIKSLRKICDFTSVSGCNISYPYVVDQAGNPCTETTDNNLARHRWFTENTSSKLGNRKRKVQILPAISDDDQELKPYQADINAKRKPVENSKNNKQAMKYEKNGVYRGRVTGYNSKKTTAQVTLDNGGKASVYFRQVKDAEYGEIDKVLSINKLVEVVYLGHENNYDQWKLN